MTEAADLRGLVRLRAAAGETVAGVEINGSGAAPGSTDSAGEFRLDFARLKPGQPATLTKVSKPGLVVLHELMLHPILLADPEVQPPWEIILCQEAERATLALDYFRLKAVRSVDEFERTQRAELAAQGGGNPAQLKALQEELAQARKQASDFAEQIAKSQPGTGTPESEQAMAFFLQGKTKEALEVLSEARLDAREEELKRAEKQNREKLANDFLLRAKLLANSLKFDDAAHAYDRAAARAPDSFDVQYQRAVFLKDLNRFEPAHAAFERCLALARQAANPSDLGKTLNQVGNLFRVQNHLAEARAALEEALALQRKLAETQTELTLGDLSRTLNDLGNVGWVEHHFEPARIVYEESLAIRRKLVAGDAAGNLPDLARTLNNLGTVHLDLGEFDDARTCYDESLAIRRKLASAQPETYLPDLANTLNNLGNLNRNVDHDGEALALYNETLAIRRKLVALNPETYQPNIGVVLTNLGLLHLDHERFAEARVAFAEAVEVRRKLAGTAPEAYLPDLDRSLNWLLQAQEELKEAEAMLATSREIVAVARQLAGLQPTPEHRQNLVRTLVQFAAYHADQGKIAEARAALQEALPIAEKLPTPEPDTRSITPDQIKGALADLQDKKP